MKTITLMLVLIPAISFAEPVVVQHAYPNAAKTAFLKSCIGLHKEMIKPCRCMLIGLQNTIPFDGFIELSKLDAPQNDPRFVAVSANCFRKRTR